MKNHDNNNYENYNNEEYNVYSDQYEENYITDEYGQQIPQLTDRQQKIASTAFGCVGWIFTAPFLIAGFLFFVFGAYGLFTLNSDKKMCTYRVEGTVVEIQSWNDTHRKSSDDEPKNTYAPVFEYEYQGKKYKDEGNYFGPSAGFSVGESVEIYVDPNDPEHIYVPSYKQKKSGSGMLMVVGAMCLAIALIVPIRMKRKTKKALTTSIPDQYY